MRNHVLILSSPTISPVLFLSRLLQELHANDDLGGCPVEMVTTRFPEGLPRPLQDLGLVHHTGHPNDADDLISPMPTRPMPFSFSRSRKTTSDPTREPSTSSRACGRWVPRRAFLPSASTTPIAARLKSVGADVVVRPIRFYPEILVRALTSPGSEEILENLFTNRGDICLRFSLRVSGLSWLDVAGRLMAAQMGPPLPMKEQRIDRCIAIRAPMRSSRRRHSSSSFAMMIRRRSRPWSAPSHSRPSPDRRPHPGPRGNQAGWAELSGRSRTPGKRAMTVVPTPGSLLISRGPAM